MAKMIAVPFELLPKSFQVDWITATLLNRVSAYRSELVASDIVLRPGVVGRIVAVYSDGTLAVVIPEVSDGVASKYARA